MALLEDRQFVMCPLVGHPVDIQEMAPDLGIGRLKLQEMQWEELTNLEQIAIGGFAVVHKAVWKGKVVAVKELTSALGENPSLKVLRRTATLSHKSVNRVMMEEYNEFEREVHIYIYIYIYIYILYFETLLLLRYLDTSLRGEELRLTHSHSLSNPERSHL